MRKLTLIALGLLMSIILVGCSDNRAKDLTEEVQNSYNQAIQESQVANEGKSLDELIDQAHGYNELNLKLNTLLRNLENSPDENYSSQFEMYFDRKPSDIDEAKQWTEDALTYIVDADRDLLSPFARKMNDAETVTNKDFEDQKMSFTVEDMASFLEETHLSSDAFGKILAMTDIYASQIEFSETGFNFSWDGSGGEFIIKYIPYPSYWYNFFDRLNACIKNYNDTTDFTNTSFISPLKTIDPEMITLKEENHTYNIEINTSGNYWEMYAVDLNDHFTDWTFMQISCNLDKASNRQDTATLLDSYFHSFAYAKAIMYALQPDISFDEAKAQAAEILNTLGSAEEVKVYTCDIDGIHYDYRVSDGPRAAISITHSK